MRRVALWWTSAPSRVRSRHGRELRVRGFALYGDTLALHHRLHGILGPTVSHHVLTVQPATGTACWARWDLWVLRVAAFGLCLLCCVECGCAGVLRHLIPGEVPAWGKGDSGCPASTHAPPGEGPTREREEEGGHIHD